MNDARTSPLHIYGWLPIVKIRPLEFNRSPTISTFICKPTSLKSIFVPSASNLITSITHVEKREREKLFSKARPIIRKSLSSSRSDIYSSTRDLHRSSSPLRRTSPEGPRDSELRGERETQAKGLLRLSRFSRSSLSSTDQQLDKRWQLLDQLSTSEVLTVPPLAPSPSLPSSRLPSVPMWSRPFTVGIKLSERVTEGGLSMERLLGQYILGADHV